ncbi:hypothetical protein HK405_004519 [Cladochytrium tenue]|nr:hypothetical protein HK405_004519 [Cladochytrium tenue]
MAHPPTDTSAAGGNVTATGQPATHPAAAVAGALAVLPLLPFERPPQPSLSFPQSGGSTSSAALVDRVRQIKHAIVGNPTRKNACISAGTGATLAKLVSDRSLDSAVRSEAAVVLGSLALGGTNEASQDKVAVLAPTATSALVDTLLANEPSLVEAGLKALSSFALSGFYAGFDSFTDEVVTKLAFILRLPLITIGPDSDSSRNPAAVARVAAAAAAFLANMSEARPWFREQVTSVGALTVVLALLDARDSFPPHQSRLSECVLGALAQLCNNSEPAAELLQGLPGANISALVALLSKLLKDKNPLVRLNAAACIGNIYRLPPFQQTLRSAVSEQVLPVLVRFFSDYRTEDEELRRAVELAPRVFAVLVRDDDVLQRVAKEGDAVEKLAQILLSEPDGVAEAKASAADSKQAPTLASVASKSKGDDCRIMEAACQCVRSLSRSVKSLRSSLVDAEVTAPLLTILSSSDPPGVAHSLELLAAASAAVSNLVLEFSPMKQAVIAGGGVELLVALTERVDDDARELRRNGLCAIKNLLHQASLELMQEVIRVFSWTRLMSLVDDSDPQVQDEALGILRNLSCVKEADADFVLDGVGASALLATVKRKLAARHGCGDSTTDDTTLHALFVVTNLACGGLPLRRLLCADEGLVELIKENLTSSNSELQHAALWCIINLTESEDAGGNATRADEADAGAAAEPPPASGGRGSADYVESLRAHGVVAVLETLAQAGGSTMDATVRERAKTALSRF